MSTHDICVITSPQLAFLPGKFTLPRNSYFGSHNLYLARSSMFQKCSSISTCDFRMWSVTVTDHDYIIVIVRFRRPRRLGRPSGRRSNTRRSWRSRSKWRLWNITIIANTEYRSFRILWLSERVKMGIKLVSLINGLVFNHVKVICSMELSIFFRLVRFSAFP